MTKRRPRKGGDCFGRAWRALVMCQFDEYVARLGAPLLLVHGYPRLTCDGKLKGRKFCHAWLECGPLCIDVGSFDGDPVRITPKALYYSVGRIDESECLRYDRQAAAKLAYETGLYSWSQTPIGVLDG